MRFTRRQFVRGGVSAFTFGFAAPQFLSELALAQGGGARNLVIVYLNGGNDALSTLVPYGDTDYFARRPTIAVPSASVLQIGTDRAGNLLGLHPSLSGLKSIFDSGKLAVVQRTGYQNSSRSHFQGLDIWGTANPTDVTGPGWLGRYLDTLPSPVDPLVGWNTSRETPRALMARTVGVPAITNPATYSFASPNSGAEAGCNTPRCGGWLRQIAARCGGSVLRKARRRYTKDPVRQAGAAERKGVDYVTLTERHKA